MQTQNSKTSTQTLNITQQSLMTLKLESKKEEKPSNSSYSVLSSSIMMACNVSSPPSSTLIGDYIGIESCLDLKNNEDVFTSSKREGQGHESCSQRRGKRDQKCPRKEFPPPIPLLARTENLHSHMPWVLKRYYTNDGRLILREEKVKHHEYFRANRCNGRLTLHLVPLDDEGLVPPFANGKTDDDNESEVDEPHFSEEEEGEKEEEEEEGEGEKEEEEEEGEGEAAAVLESKDFKVNENGGDDCDEIIKEDFLCEDQKVPSVESGIGGIGGNGSGAGKCLNYNSVRTSSTFIFGVPVPAIRPVHS